MKTLSSGALLYLQSAIPLLFFLGLLSSPPAAGAGLDDYKDDADVLDLTLSTATVPPSRTEAMNLLAGICGPSHVQASKKGSLYCDQAPGYPDEDNAWCGLEIQGVLRGHFTSPRADEAVADYLGGCEPHANDSGGSILLRKEDGVWRRIAYFPGDRSARCLAFPRRDGRDALVCGRAFSGQGETDANIELRSLEPGVEAEDLLDVHSLDGAGYCEISSAGERQLHSRFKSWERRPATAGTPARLIVQVETEDFVTPDFCGKHSDTRDLDEKTAKALNDKFETFRTEQRRIETVTFDWDGEQFLLSSPLSSPALLDAQSSDHDADEGDDDDSDVLMLPLSTETAQPSLTETRSLLAGICGPEEVQAEKEDGTLYCDTAPGYPDRDADSCGLDIRRGVLHGHFTSPKADEVVADYTGCEPHAGDYGGSILLRKENGLWRRIAYFPRDRAARCLVFSRRDGRDALVCGRAFSGQGEYQANIELRSLKPGVKPEDLFDVHSKDGTALCEHFSAGERQIHTRFKGWERLAATQGTPARLVVQVEIEDFVTPAFCGKPSDNEDLDDATAKALNDKFDAFRAQHRRIGTVTFDWNGERFVKKAS